MRCGEAKNWLSLAHDDCLPPDRTLPLERHLEGCAECRAYRDDLRLASRMLAATEPRLSDSFDWRLGLRLNQRLTEAARYVPAPWERARAASWWGRFGVGAAAGVLAAAGLGAWVLPVGVPVVPMAAAPVSGPVVAEQTEEMTDRLPLQEQFSFRSGRAANVNYGQRGSFRRDSGNVIGWSGANPADLRVINSLREDNQRLRAALGHAQRQIEALKAQSGRQAAAEFEAATTPLALPSAAPAEAMPSSAPGQR